MKRIVLLMLMFLMGTLKSFAGTVVISNNSWDPPFRQQINPRQKSQVSPPILMSYQENGVTYKFINHPYGILDDYSANYQSSSQGWKIHVSSTPQSIMRPII